MDPEKQNELKTAYHILCEYDLWRKGRIDTVSFDENEITVALETAAGAILDYIACETRRKITASTIGLCENALGHAQAEVRRLKSILASHHIQYRKKKE